jgi:uncharacterized protein (DUF58 family)
MWYQNIFKNRRPQPTANHEGAIDEPSREPFILSAMAIKQLNRLQLNASRYLYGYSIGNRPSNRRKPSAEFHEHRAYAPGDDTRMVDWKASARQEHIFIKQGQQPKEITVYLILDCSRSMAWGKPPKSDKLLQIAIALGYLALSGGDRLVIVSLTDKGTKVFGPISGKGQFLSLLRQLREIKFTGKCQSLPAAEEINRRAISKGGLVFVLSDLLELDDLQQTLEILPPPTWEVSVIQILHRMELEPIWRGDFEMADCETNSKHNYDISPEAVEKYKRHLAEWLSDLEILCVDQNAFYCMIPGDWALETNILASLRKNNILKPA